VSPNYVRAERISPHYGGHAHAMRGRAACIGVRYDFVPPDAQTRPVRPEFSLQEELIIETTFPVFLPRIKIAVDMRFLGQDFDRSGMWTIN
jgi:hypothetical protein